MNTSALTILRVAATAGITGLSAAFAYYPDQLWIPAVIAAMAAVGIHVIPAVGQTMVTINPPIGPHVIMPKNEPFTGDPNS